MISEATEELIFTHWFASIPEAYRFGVVHRGDAGAIVSRPAPPATLEKWLAAIAIHRRETRRAVQKDFRRPRLDGNFVYAA